MMTSQKYLRTVLPGLEDVYLLVNISNAYGFYLAEIRNTLNRLYENGSLISL